MRFKLLYAMLVAALLAAAFAALTLPASAELRTFRVKLPTGELITVTVDAPAGVPMSQVPGLPGVPVEELTPPAPEEPAPKEEDPAPAPQEPAGQPGGGDNDTGGGGDRDRDRDRPRSDEGEDQDKSGKRRQGKDRDGDGNSESQAETRRDQARRRRARARARQRQSRRERLRNPDGSPTRQNPTFFDALPAPGKVTSVPNFVIRKFRVPIFLLPIYQAAGMQYGIRWEVLAAINEIETDYGRNLNVSSAGALGWMQFMPATWKMYGIDANKDGEKDPYNPVDAIFAAARYLKAAGAEQDLRRAIFAYNHADWYVDSVMLRARLISGVPDGLLGSLTGLTDARFPVAARARYADDVSEDEAERRIKRGQNAANVVEGDEERRGIEIYTRKGAPAVAVQDGVIKKIGRSRELGRYIVLQDVYGNRYTYAGLGKLSTHYPVPKNDVEVGDGQVTPSDDPAPAAPASAGRQVSDATDSATDSAPQPDAVPKQRLFAHPNRPAAKRNGGAEQVFDAEARREQWETYGNFFVRPLGLNASNANLKRLKKGARVIGGTVLGRIGKPDPEKAAHLYFEIRPAGRGAPRIDPKPILDGWKLLESTAVYRASGRNVLYGDDGNGYSVGQLLLLPKSLLERRVLSDPRMEIYPCGRRDIRTGQINRRVLATLAYLTEVGLRPTVTSLKCGHGFYTKSGNVSHHSSGNAVDIAAVNGIPILGHQEKGGITHQTVRRLMMMQGTLKPAQIISLLELGANTIAMGDHHDHIHVGFTPLFGANRKQGQQALQILKPGQWEDLVDRLGEIDNPVVPRRVSRYSLPTRSGKRHSSHAHRGE